MSNIFLLFIGLCIMISFTRVCVRAPMCVCGCGYVIHVNELCTSATVMYQIFEWRHLWITSFPIDAINHVWIIDYK